MTDANPLPTMVASCSSCGVGQSLVGVVGNVPVNILLITLDQFRGDCLSCDGHPVVQTPNLDAVASQGVRLSRHYSQAAPCGPGRACLYTGTYQLNNRVVGNGTPLDNGFDNVARAARRVGYTPVVFGYADQSLDPRSATGPDDPRLLSYQGYPPGFDVALELPDDQTAWRAWLEDLGYGDAITEGEEALASEGRRPAEHGVSAFLTNAVIAWLQRQDRAWFAHVSYWRPHPPYAAAGQWSEQYDPAATLPPMAPPERETPFCGRLAAIGPPEGAEFRFLASQYYGMISDVDDQLGRLVQALVDLEMWDDTFVVITSDHGEQLGDQGRLGKGGEFESSYHIPGIVRDPRHSVAHGTVVDRFTENVDIFPTICEAIGLEVPAQCDGLPLTSFLTGTDPPWWRDAAHWEYDWRWEYLPFGPHQWPWDRRLESKHLAVSRSESVAYVQFGNGEWRCYDVEADRSWRHEVDDPDIVLSQAQSMLTWRSRHADRVLSDMLIAGGTIGRVPQRLE